MNIRKINGIVVVLFLILLGVSVGLQVNMNKKNAFEEDARKSIEAGMNAHLAKPLKIEHVIAVIAKYCDRCGR